MVGTKARPWRTKYQMAGALALCYLDTVCNVCKTATFAKRLQNACNGVPRGTQNTEMCGELRVYPSIFHVSRPISVRQHESAANGGGGGGFPP